ncbi:MAG: PAS domain-containing sensor histidine kinase [bacterium]|nr:PAS domain-containing sensor histidine kinase [bacterium]
MITLETENSFRMQSLNALFEHATEGIVIADQQGTIVRANPSSERLFGYKPGELQGKVIEDLVPTRFVEGHTHHRAGYNAHPHARSMGKNMTLFGKRKDNSEFPLEISLSYYKQDGEQFVISFIIDVTERKRQEANIIRLNMELENKVEERTKVLQEALIELENSKEQLSIALEAEKELNDMKSRFVTMASHEFRTPLSTILSSISLVNKYNESLNDEKVSKHVNRIKSAVTNMTLILNDFLSAEKLEEGKVFLRKEELDLQKLANEVIGEIQGILKTGQKVVYHHVGPSIALFDRQMVRNILLNLISNAIKFSPENRTIKVTTDISEAEIKIEVSDEGIGIPKEEQDHLFERFFRAKNVTNIQGTGLGLNIIGKYLETMQGRIEFTSELNKGTTFNITIPNE